MRSASLSASLLLALANVASLACSAVPPSSPAAPSARTELSSSAAALGGRTPAGSASSPLVYPSAARGAVVDDYHGTKVADPYRWLEDPTAADTRTWVAAETKLSSEYLTHLPGRARLLDRIRTMNDVERFTPPLLEGRRYFWFHNDGRQEQDVLFWGKAASDPGQVLLDPNTLSKDGTVSLNNMGLSHDGKYVAYALSTGGSDWQEWHVREVSTGKDLPDRLQWSKFSDVSFSRDGKGFFYARYPQPAAGTSMEGANYDDALYYHRLGEPQAKDTLVYRRPDLREWDVRGVAATEGDYLFITLSKSANTKNMLYYRDLRQTNAPVLPLLTSGDALYTPVAHQGTKVIVLTNKDAPNGKAVLVDLNHPEPEHWTTLVAEEKEKLDAITRVGDRLFLTYVRDAHARVVVRDAFASAPATSHDLQLPGIGTVEGFSGNPGDGETFWTYRSFTEPGIVYRHDMSTGEDTELRRVKTAFDPARYETKQVFYSSKDGTKVPMFIVARKGLVLDGNNPTLLRAYGGFGYSDTPEFQGSMITWLDKGGVFANANIRGGGEYGEAWHAGGTRKNKQNGLDDFIAGAEWLIATHYTSTPRLAIEGGSNGGLLVGAVEMQRPELFAAVVAEAGVMDMLRYQDFTIGHQWAGEYGTSDDAELFPVLFKYSPLHNVKPGTRYPATLLTTADHDDRVVPAHSYKLAAALQAAQAGDAPILLRVETDAGHGEGTSRSKSQALAADVWSFVAQALGVPEGDTLR